MTTDTITRTGIATIYRGTRYRSRLEARWAAFFDLIGWEAHYEPFDLNGWIHDFVLHGAHQRTLVEVKPVAGMNDELFKETVCKIRSSAWTDEVLIVSYFLPTEGLSDWDCLCVGWLCDREVEVYLEGFDAPGERMFWDWELAPFQESTTAVSGFCHYTGGFHDRISGHHRSGFGGDDAKIEELWAQAGNVVQWTP